MRPLQVVLLVMVLFVYTSIASAQAKFETGTKAPAVPVVTETPQANADGEMPSAQGLRRMTIRERRDAGVTIHNLRVKAKELYEDGQIDKDMSRAEISALIFSELQQDNPKAFADPTLDLDAILAFIEALLPIILALIGMFS